jgi:ATP-dependent DNA helicase RecG
MTESQTIEFKQIWKDEYLKTICAFTNTDGGNLYIKLQKIMRV